MAPPVLRTDTELWPPTLSMQYIQYKQLKLLDVAVLSPLMIGFEGRLTAININISAREERNQELLRETASIIGLDIVRLYYVRQVDQSGSLGKREEFRIFEVVSLK